MVCASGQENRRLLLLVTAHGVFAFRQHGAELTVGWIHLDDGVGSGTARDELDPRVSQPFNQRWTGKVAHEPDPSSHRMHPYLFVGPSALHGPVRDIAVTASLQADWQGTDDVAWKWGV